MIFYLALLTFGIDSAFSMVEPMASSIQAKWNISKAHITAILCIIGFSISIFFALGSGLHWLNILDHFIANFGLVMIGLVQCIILGWVYNVSKLREHANKTSEIKIGKWWDYLIKIVIPTILLILLIMAIHQSIIIPYQGYPWWVLILGGFTPCISIVILALVLMKIKNKKEAA